MEGLIESDEAARRLGVKLPTLYVYVSRGMLTSHRGKDRRRSLFDLREIEALATRSRHGREGEFRLAPIATSVTHLVPDGPMYRGVSALSLVGQMTFEQVAELLWQEDAEPWVPRRHPDGLFLADRSIEEQIRCIVVLEGETAPLTSSPSAIAQAGRSMIASIVHTLARNSGAVTHGETRIAEQLTATLIGDHQSATAVDAVEAIMILLADHELTPPTLAVRIAASTQADLNNAILAGLGVSAGPFRRHEAAYHLLVEAERSGVSNAIDTHLGTWGRLRGTGSEIYAAQDPRFQILHSSFETIASPRQSAVFNELLECIRTTTDELPSVDLAVAAITWALGANASAGYAISTIARIAGWVAHYVEELEEQPLRLRPRALYVNPRDRRPPGSPSHAEEPIAHVASFVADSGTAPSS